MSTYLARPTRHLPTEYENGFTPEYYGRNLVTRDGRAPEGTSIEWDCIRISIEPLSG